uniref:DUF5018-related domain-containing protein n=1 Tax=Leyella stercorea TaxID=363265 RepID=UPI003FEFD359
MKILKFIIAMFVMALSCTSCLESNFEELDTYDGNDITAGYAWYRYKGDNKLNASGEQQVIQKQLQRTGQVIDNEAATCALQFKVPTNFSDAEKNGVNINNIVVAVEISTAAVMTPVEGSPKLGVPADWSTPHKYSVKAADGKTKIWTVSVTLTK